MPNIDGNLHRKWRLQLVTVEEACLVHNKYNISRTPFQDLCESFEGKVGIDCACYHSSWCSFTHSCGQGVGFLWLILIHKINVHTCIRSVCSFCVCA